jgi:hypothetical protein
MPLLLVNTDRVRKRRQKSRGGRYGCLFVWIAYSSNVLDCGLEFVRLQVLVFVCWYSILFVASVTYSRTCHAKSESNSGTCARMSGILTSHFHPISQNVKLQYHQAYVCVIHFDYYCSIYHKPHPSQAINQPEDIIVYIILSGRMAHKLKRFTKVQRIAIVNTDGASDKNQNGIGGNTGLNINCIDRVLESSKGFQLVDNGLGTLELVCLERHHGLRRL